MVVGRFRWRCHAYCLMPNHFHLVVETPDPNISAGMQLLNGRYAQLFNRRHDRHGHLFESRFSAWVIRDEAHIEAACRYVLDNPARAGIDEPWPWAGYIGGDWSSRRTSSSSTSEKSSYERPTA